MLDQAQKRSSKTECIQKKGKAGFSARVKKEGKWFYISTYEAEAEARAAIQEFHRRLKAGDTTAAMVCMTMQVERKRKPRHRPPYYKKGDFK